MTHAEMVELNERQRREHDDKCAAFEAQAQKYRNIVFIANLAMAQAIEQMNAPWRQLEAELRAMKPDGPANAG